MLEQFITANSVTFNDFTTEKMSGKKASSGPCLSGAKHKIILSFSKNGWVDTP